MKTLRVDGRGKFILYKFQVFYKKKGISIKYAVLYMYKENGLAKQGWRIIVTMKNSMLIDSGLSNGFWSKAIEIANYL